MVALQNPCFQPKTHRWRPAAGAPSEEVPSQNCPFCAPKQLFFSQKGRETQSKRTNEGICLVHLLCALTSSWQRALCCPLTPQYFRETAQKWLQMAAKVRCFCQTAPKPRTGPILGYVPRIRILRATSPPGTPHFWWFSSLRVVHRDARTPVPVVTWWSRRVALPAHGGEPLVGPPGCPGQKKNFFPKFLLDHLGCSHKYF